MRIRHRVGRRTALATLVTLTAGIALAPLAIADPAPLLPGYAPQSAEDSLDPVLSDAIVDAEGRVDVFVQTTGDGALAIARDAEQSGASDAAVDRAVDEQVSATTAITDEVQEQATDADPDVDVLYTASYTVPGIALSVDAAALPDLAARDDVVAISPIVPRSLELPEGAEPTNGNADALTEAVSAWQQTGRTGANVHVAVIDTGLDYTHADFGGLGTTSAYSTALASTAAPDPSWYDSAKFLGGFDFAGTSYNADSTSGAYNPVPQPDANPIDGEGGGHGTHVAGTAAGYGVRTDGSTFTGDYTTLAPEAVQTDFTVAPGSAPQAGLYALKVFGDGGGSTSVTGAALEWIGQAIADGVQIDVVNLSLGTSYGAVDDPDNAKLATLMDAGVLPVVAAGNSGDLIDVAGSPGTTERALTVAASSTGRAQADGVELWHNADPGGAPTAVLTSQFSQNYVSPGFSVVGRVVRTSAANADGCLAFSDSDRAAVQGNIVVLAWNDSDVACGSATRFTNAADAGAVGVLLESQANSFENGIAGSENLPGAQITADATAQLDAALDAGGLVVVGLSDAQRATVPVYDVTRVDTLASFSSRGTHGSVDQVIKPDVSAPGVQVISAGRGTGAGSATMSGTSMATPHTAGIAALVVEAHPQWTPDQVKMAVMNTATHDVLTTDGSRTVYGPMRAGTGRVDALAAVTNEVLAGSADNGYLVTASFGVVDVGAAGVNQTRTVTVTNTSSQPVSYTAAYLPRTETPGVAITLDDADVTVPAGGTATVTVRLRIDDPTALRHTMDPTMAAQQGGAPRQFVTDASGVVQLTPVSGTIEPLRVAVAAVPKPVSETTVSGITFADGTATDGALTLTGRGVSQGSGSEAYTSLVVPMQLGVEDPVETFPADAALQTLRSLDIRAVGAASTAPQLDDPSQGLLSIGIVTDGDWPRISPLSYPVVSLDVNGDSRTDFYTYTSMARDADVPLAVTVDAVTSAPVDRRPVNNLFGTTDTNAFDNNVMVLPVSLEAMGYTPGTTMTTLRYAVRTTSYYAPGFQTTGETLVDETGTATFDVYRPAVWFGPQDSAEGTVAFQDAAGTIATHRTRGTTAQALVLRMHGADGARSSVLSVPQATGGDGTPGPSATPPVDPGPTPGVPVPPTTGATTAGPRGGHLARTGIEVAVVAGIGALLLAAGTVAIQIRRRRARQVPVIGS